MRGREQFINKLYTTCTTDMRSISLGKGRIKLSRLLWTLRLPFGCLSLFRNGL